jgi:sugar lactone lactonase YvrE
LANNLPGPDDLALAPDGSLYISDIQDGTVKRLGLDGSLQTMLSGLSVPEGMVFLPDGSLVIAEQGKNRLIHSDLKTKTLTVFYQLSNRTNQDGVDGIALDDHGKDQESLIVPDSPNGTIFRLSLDGQKGSKIASGLARPTGAWVEPDGSILVTDENAGTLLRVHPDGQIDTIAHFSIPDDVVEDPAGNIFVVSIGDHAVHAILVNTGQDVVLTNHLSSPQGLTFDRDGNLIVSDSGNHRILKLSFID